MLHLLIMLMSTRSLHGIFPNCTNVEFFEASSLSCLPCPLNTSMRASDDGFSCTCDHNSVKTESGRCRPCNVTEVVSTDGGSCVARHCQASAGRIACRKCPKDYIIVTQNHDGSSLKEVQCVKCSRGFKAQDNKCVRCDGCACKRNEIVVHGRCLPKKYVMERPKYEENLLHPSDILNIVKNEYLCTIIDVAACRWLANACVGNFYSSDPAGACRLWIHPKQIINTVLPMLSANKSDSAQRKDEEIQLSNGQNTLLIAGVGYNNDGNFKYLLDSQKRIIPCLPPFEITIGEDYSTHCTVNILETPVLFHEIYALYMSGSDNMKPLSISMRKPNGHLVQKGLWQSNKFAKYFLFRRSLSATSNHTNLIYLRSLLIRLRIERTQLSTGSLKLNINIEAQYAVESPPSDKFLTSVKVTHDLPNAGVLRGLEIWGSILSILMACYAITQWRGAVRRGGLQISLLPLLAGSIADALYFATWSTVLHALAAKAGTLDLTLPLSQSEESVIKVIIYTVVFLKILKIAYVNWILCRCDIFFIDWSEYNPYLKDSPMHAQSSDKKSVILAREWMTMQTRRRTTPGPVVILTLLILRLMAPWQEVLPKSDGYKWAIATIAWWSSYAIVFFNQMIINRLFECPTKTLQKICTSMEFSMLVFQEDLYAHYVHGRNDDPSEARYFSGPLSTCRVACAAQFRTICKQLLTSEQRTLEKYDSRQVLLSRFLAAFFERALDGLSWVASERTTLEKLFDVEIIAREGGNTSILLYELDNLTPSCFVITWWGNEWLFATFDSIIFSSVLFATQEPLYAAFTTVAIWQIMKYTVIWFARKNMRDKTNVNTF